MKRPLSLLLAVVLSFGLMSTVFATSDEATKAADTLHELGLFNGTGTAADGNPIYDLDRAPTRHEAVTMLVRLLGKEDEALAGTWETPFTDVAVWAKPYVGYAYANGLTSGTSATTFGGNSLITASQYLTFVLRALGYSSDTDFRWDAAWELSDKLGITNGQYNAANVAAFLRSDIALISESALSAKMRSTSQTLLEKLEAEGAIKVPEQGNLRPEISPEDLVFQAIPDEFIRQFGTSSTYSRERIEYALCGDEIYFRIHYSGVMAETVYLMPRDMTTEALGDFKQFTTSNSNGVFTCKIEKSVLADYPAIGIRQSETEIIEEQILTGYLMLTEDGSSAAFQSADYVPADNNPTDATDFQIDSLEYAEVLGGRVYRLRFTQSVERNIMLFTLQANQSTNWNNNIALFKMGMSAGSHELLYFVSNSALRDYSRVLIRVRNANHSNECNFYIDLNPDDDPKNNG